MSKTSTDNDTARRVIAEEAEIMRLTREDQIRFAEALVEPPKANARLARAAKTHAHLIVNRLRIASR